MPQNTEGVVIGTPQYFEAFVLYFKNYKTKNSRNEQ